MKFATSIFLILIGTVLVLWSQNQAPQTDTLTTQTSELTKQQPAQPSYKKLYRSRENRMIAGICSGLGEYFDVDPTVIRLVAAAGALMGIGIVAYLVAWIIIPQQPQQKLP